MYNEEASIGILLQNLERVISSLNHKIEIVVVDDGSTDTSFSIVENFQLDSLKLVGLPRNEGKGAAVRHGVAKSSGDFVLIQDADLEYDPREIVKLLGALSEGEPIAVYGSRVLGSRDEVQGIRGFLGLWPGQGVPQWAFNTVLSIYHYAITGVWLSDLLTGYKLYPRGVFQDWVSRTSGFETDHEITMRLHSSGIRIIEVPISYSPRSKKQGKKIRARDALTALRTIWRFRKQEIDLWTKPD